MTMAAASALKARREVVTAVRGVWRDMEETPVKNQMDCVGERWAQKAENPRCRRAVRGCLS